MVLDLGLRSASELAGMIRRKQLSSVELLDHYLARIDDLNGDLNAVVTLDLDRARLSATVADEAERAGESFGPLHGLPLTVKDALATAGIRTTGGAVELADNVPVADAVVVERVKRAGAVVFGKTNLPRWSGDVQAFNDIFGTTNNPWALDRVPGGSSGGASAAVAAGLTSFEIGTDIGGSIRLPAHFAGVCGYKPSFGVVPAHGYVDHVTGGTTEPDINVIGPLARTVDDLELVFDTIAGPADDQAVGWRLELPSAPSEFRVAAWLDDPACPVGADVAAALDRAVASLGVEVARSARPDVDFGEVWETGLPLISAATSPGRTEDEFAAMRRLAIDPPPDADPILLMRSQASAMFHRDWALLTERREAVRRAWADFFTSFDILLCPVAIAPAIEHQQEGTLYTRSITLDGGERPYADLIAWTSFIGFAYLPSTVVPVGLTPNGLPVGIQVVAPFLGDRSSLAFARHVEAMTGGYQPPPLAG